MFREITHEKIYFFPFEILKENKNKLGNLSAFDAYEIIQGAETLTNQLNNHI